MSTGEAPGAGPHPFSDLDRLIHSPARLMVMTTLYVVEEAEFIFLMKMTGLTWGNLSAHLSMLEEGGYIAITKSFVGKKGTTMIRLTEAGQAAYRAYKEKFQEVFGRLPE
jgi:DNA-binding MarR family transcriptional regulator